MWQHGNYWGGFFPMMIGGGFMMLVFCGLIIWLVIYAIRSLSPNEKLNHVDSAVDILRQRYAKGEISVEEYRERIKELKNITK